jgi:hypothetical protein
MHRIFISQLLNHIYTKYKTSNLNYRIQICCKVHPFENMQADTLHRLHGRSWHMQIITAKMYQFNPKLSI